jgi:hypothetical protein
VKEEERDDGNEEMSERERERESFGVLMEEESVEKAMGFCLERERERERER